MTPTSTTKTHACFTCKQLADQRCSTCSNARYCSTTCQQKDWKMHKMLCKSFAVLEPRPGPAFFRAILFPPDEPLPRFVWVEYDHATEYTTMRYKIFTGKHILGHIASEQVENACGWPLKEPDSHRLGIYYKDAYLVDNSPITPSVTKWVGRQAGHYFRGVFLAHGWKENVVEREGILQYGKPCDLDTTDLSYLLEFFRAQGEMHRKMYGDFKSFK